MSSEDRGVQVEARTDAEEFWPRVASTPGALYGQPRRSTKRRRCHGHLVDPHFIAAGDLAIWSALPPDHPDIGNDGWWHSIFCTRCAPVETIPIDLVTLTDGGAQ